jgi:hypothetical protein
MDNCAGPAGGVHLNREAWPWGLPAQENGEFCTQIYMTHPTSYGYELVHQFLPLLDCPRPHCNAESDSPNVIVPFGVAATIPCPK